MEPQPDTECNQSLLMWVISLHCEANIIQWKQSL